MYTGIILCGQACSGKSTTLRVLVESLSEMASGGGGGGGGGGVTSASVAGTSSVDSFEQSLDPSSFKRKNVQKAHKIRT